MNERHIDRPQWWAVLCQKSGYTIDVYPSEAAQYQRSLSGAFGRYHRVVGQFATQGQAEAALADALEERAGAGARAK